MAGTDVTYAGSCGWSGTSFNSKNRSLFRFSVFSLTVSLTHPPFLPLPQDSWLNNYALNASLPTTPAAIIQNSGTSSFAGAVCIKDFAQCAISVLVCIGRN